MLEDYVSLPENPGKPLCDKTRKPVISGSLAIFDESVASHRIRTGRGLWINRYTTRTHDPTGNMYLNYVSHNQ